VAGAEEVEDTQIVHAIAPGSSLGLALVPANATTSAAGVLAGNNERTLTDINGHLCPH
jgi:hypothetical protein